VNEVSPNFYLAATVAIVFCGGLLYNAIKKYKAVRKIEDTAKSNIATAPQGYVEFQGFAWPMQKSVQCTQGFEAVYYSFLLQRQETQGSGKKKKKVWVTKYSYGHSEPFYVVDSTGLAVIMPEQAQYDLESARTKSWSTLSSNEKSKVIERVGGSVTGFPPAQGFFGLFAAPYRIVENEIRVGSPLYVHGDFKALAAEPPVARAAGLTDFFGKVFDPVNRSVRDLRRLLDKNGDGGISSSEAKNGYSIAATMALKKAEQGSVEEKEFQIHGRLQTSETHKLFVADVHQGHLVLRMKRFLWLQFGGSTVVLALSLIALLDPLALVGEPERAAQHNQSVVIKPQPQMQKKRVIASQSEATAFHRQCIQNVGWACASLVNNAKEFNLTEQHIKYYGAQACKAGFKNHCK
jgi:hypothetical protein